MLTVLIATRNGAAWLGRSLGSMLDLAEPEGGWKLIAIDNGSTDATGEILRSFLGRLPLEIVHTPRPSKNAALNVVLACIEGDLVVFTDDDVLVDPQWLVRLREAADVEQGYTVFGGAIRPEWPSAPEAWITDLVPLGLTYCVTPQAPRGRCIPEAVWGPNMAVRAAVFHAGLRFDETIGPDGSTTYAMGSETSFTRRLAALGRLCFHVPEAVVGHIIRQPQMTRSFALARAYRGGRGKGVLSHEFERVARIGGLPRYFFGNAGRAALHYARACLAGDENRAFKAAWDWNFALGCIRGARTARLANAAARLSAAQAAAPPADAAAPILPSPVPA